MQEESAVVLEPARQHLAALKTISKRLNDASDAFTGELQEIEDELNRLGVGLEVTLAAPIMVGELEEITDDGGVVEERYRESIYLGYGRIFGGWRLLAREYRDYEEHDEVRRSVSKRDMPLLESARNVRIAAAERISDLLELIKFAAAEKIAALERVTDKK